MKWRSLIVTLLLALSTLPVAHANAPLPNSPSLTFSPMNCGGETMWDTVGDVNNAVLDLVGNATYPAVQTASNATNLYVRMLLDESPMNAQGNLKSFAWGLEFDTDGNVSTYEHLIIANGAGSDALMIQNNTVTNSPNDPTDSTESTSYTFATTSDHWNVTAADSSFSSTTDYWLTFILPWTVLDHHNIDRNTTTAYWFGTSTQSSNINGDFVCHDGLSTDPVTLEALASDTDSLDPATRLTYANSTMVNGVKVVNVTMNNNTSTVFSPLLSPPDATYEVDGASGVVVNATVDASGNLSVDALSTGYANLTVYANTTVGSETLSANTTFFITVNGSGSSGNASVDSDGDGVPDASDAFPYDANESADSDGDGVGDNADFLPNDASQTIDSDGDGCGDNATGTNGDAFPLDGTECSDSDGDGVGDNGDDFPNDANETTDSDGDGVGDNGDDDDDNDGVVDDVDAFPLDPSTWTELAVEDDDGGEVSGNVDDVSNKKAGLSFGFFEFFIAVLSFIVVVTYVTREQD